MQHLRLGPILGLENETLYSVCFLLIGEQEEAPKLHIDDKSYDAHILQSEDWGVWWRVKFPVKVKPQGYYLNYRLECEDKQITDSRGRSRWQFYLPGADEAPRMAFASCNDVLKKGHVPGRSDYQLWQSMWERHQEAPYSLLLMGGDQVYADHLLGQMKSPRLRRWWDAPLEQQVSLEPSESELEELAFGFAELYVRSWDQQDVSLMLASVPSLMMWDDHDIIDGYGSYPEPFQQSQMMQALYKIAEVFFVNFQLRGHDNASLLGEKAALSWGLKFRGQAILAMDNRSERTETMIMSHGHWQQLQLWLDEVNNDEKLWVMTAVPLMYPSFESVEPWIGKVPVLNKYEDDLKDHWRAIGHREERIRFLQTLSDARKRLDFVSILSGDVHVGALAHMQTPYGGVHQLVSSAIVNHPPSWFAWHMMSMFADMSPEEIQQLHIRQCKPFAGRAILRAANYCEIDCRENLATWVAEKRNYSLQLD